MKNNFHSKLLKYPIAAWVLILLAVIITFPLLDESVESTEKDYMESVEGNGYGDYDLYKKLGEVKRQNVKTRLTLIHILGVTTLVTFSLQIKGLRHSDDIRMYKWSTFIFGGLTLLYVVLLFFMAIVPTGPFF